MMRYLLIALLLGTAFGQVATRPITLSWVDSPSASVTGYSLYLCTSTTAVACTPNTAGAPAQTFTSTATSGVVQGTVGLYYTMVLVANAPACTASSSVTTPCGNSAPAVMLPNPLPVPPQVNSATALTLAVP